MGVASVVGGVGGVSNRDFCTLYCYNQPTNQSNSQPDYDDISSLIWRSDSPDLAPGALVDGLASVGGV